MITFDHVFQLDCVVTLCYVFERFAKRRRVGLPRIGYSTDLFRLYFTAPRVCTLFTRVPREFVYAMYIVVWKDEWGGGCGCVGGTHGLTWLWPSFAWLLRAPCTSRPCHEPAPSMREYSRYSCAGVVADRQPLPSQ